MTINFDLQTAYNVVSTFGFLICMYKIHKIEQELSQLKTHQFIHTVTSFVMAKKLKEKGIIDDNEIAVEIENETKKL